MSRGFSRGRVEKRIEFIENLLGSAAKVADVVISRIRSALVRAPIDTFALVYHVVLAATLIDDQNCGVCESGSALLRKSGVKLICETARNGFRGVEAQGRLD